VFATTNLLELGGDVCDNLSFMNILKLTVLKFVKIREFQELLKFTKFEFSIYGVNVPTVSLSERTE